MGVQLSAEPRQHDRSGHERSAAKHHRAAGAGAASELLNDRTLICEGFICRVGPARASGRRPTISRSRRWWARVRKPALSHPTTGVTPALLGNLAMEFDLSKPQKLLQKSARDLFARA